MERSALLSLQCQDIIIIIITTIITTVICTPIGGLRASKTYNTLVITYVYFAGKL